MERTLVVIRERDLPGLLDLAIVVVRREFVTLLGASLLGIVPFAAFNAWWFATTPDLPPGLPVLFWILEAPIATAPLTVVLGELMFGRRPTPARVAAALGRSAWTLILVHGLLRFLAFFWIPTRLAFANEMIVLERISALRVLVRGRELCGDRAGEVVTVGLLQLILTFVLAFIFSLWASMLAGFLLREDLSWDMAGDAEFAGWTFQLPIWAATAFFAVVRFLLYIDQRVRLEGWAVKLRLREVGRSMEEARRW